MKKTTSSDKNKISRRSFVKNATFSAGGLMMLGSLPVSASAYAQGSDLLKVALVGCGGRGTGAANQTLTADDGVKLVAMADIFPDRLNSSLERLSQRYGPEKLEVPRKTGSLVSTHIKKRLNWQMLLF